MQAGAKGRRCNTCHYLRILLWQVGLARLLDRQRIVVVVAVVLVLARSDVLVRFGVLLVLALVRAVVRAVVVVFLVLAVAQLAHRDLHAVLDDLRRLAAAAAAGTGGAIDTAATGATGQLLLHIGQ